MNKIIKFIFLLFISINVFAKERIYVIDDETKIIENIVGGKLEGQRVGIDKSNDIIFIQNYKNNLPHGVWIQNYNKKIVETIIYKDGNRIELKRFDEDGNLKLRLIYKDGKPLLPDEYPKVYNN